MKIHINFRLLVDWSGGWASAPVASLSSQSRAFLGLIERPQESAHPERKSTLCYGAKPIINF